MIKANEVRIGNLVNIEGRAHYWRYNDYEYYTGQNLELIDVTPMALSPAMLEKVGFEKRAGGSEFHHREISWYLRLPESNVHPWDVVLSVGTRHQIIRSFYYVHQLQNIFFALTEKELRIQL